MTRSPKAVLLDVGGVFLLPSRSHIRSALDQVGHVVTDDDAIDRAHYEALRVFPMDLDGDEWMSPAWTEYLFAYVTGWLWTQLIAGSVEGLAEIAATGVELGVVSNADGTIEARLAEMGVLQVGVGPGVDVRCVVDSGAVGVEKPNPAIFEPALEVLGVDPEDVWYVGDTPAFDVVGAERAGLTPILMDPFGVNGDFGVRSVATLSEVAHSIS